MTPRKRKLIQPTFLFPMVSVGLLLAAFFVYYFPVTERQAASLNRRAFRSLATISDSLKNRVVTYAFVLEQTATRLDRPENLAEYRSAADALAQQAPDFTLDRPEGTADCIRGNTTVSTTSGNGTYQLQLRCGKWSLTGHLGRMLAPFLRGAPTQIFDDVLLVDAEGLVLHQTIKTGSRINNLKSAKLDAVASAAANTSPAPASGSQGATAPSFAAASQSSSLHSVVIGGESYRLYLVPVPLTLAQPPPAPAAAPAAQKPAQPVAGTTTHLVLGGLVRDEVFRAGTRAIPGTALVSVILLLLVIVVATWPLLKFTAMRATERVPRRSAVYLFLSTLATIILMCVLVIHFRYIYDMRSVDGNLKRLAQAMERHLEDELRQALQVIDSAEHSDLFKADVQARSSQALCEGSGVAAAQMRSRERLLTVPGLRLSDYPYFDRLFWSDTRGSQQIKWDLASQPTAVTYVGDRPYYIETLGNRLWQFAAPPRANTRFRVDSVFSRNTGEYRAVISRRARRATLCGDVELTVVSLVTPLLSLIDPIMPPDYGFAMVDETGEVLFHSTSNKNGQERFVDEVEDPGELQLALFARQGKLLTTRYLGFDHRLFVTPLVKIEQSPWSLIVFHNLSEGAAQHLERIVVFSWLTLAYYLMLGIILMFLPKTERPPTWIWPRSHARGSYIHLALGLALIAPLFYLLIFEMSNIGSILATAFLVPVLMVAVGISKLKSMDGIIRWLALLTLGFGVLVIRLEPRPTISVFLLFVSIAAALVFVTIRSVSTFFGSWRLPTLSASFAMLWASMLMLLGLLPCVAFFKVAYDYHEGLSTRRLQIQTIAALADREERVKAHYGSRELTSYPKNSERADVARWLFLRRRLEQSLDRYDTEFLSSKPGQVFSSATRRYEAGACEDGLPSYLARLAYVPYGGGTLSRMLSEPSSDNSTWRWCREGSNRVRLVRQDDVASRDVGTASLPPTRALLKSVTADPTFLRAELVSELPVLQRWSGAWPIVALVLTWLITFFWIKPTLQQMFLLKIKRTEPLPELALDDTTPISKSMILLGLDTAPTIETLRRRKADVFLIDFGEVMRGNEPSYAAITQPVVAIEHFDYRNDSDDANRKKLDILERLASHDVVKHVVIVTTIDPIFYFCAGADFSNKPSLETLTPGQDLERWSRAMVRFARYRLPGTASCSTIEHGRLVWSTCTTPERVALYQLAHDGWVNPRNEAALTQLQLRGLIRDMPFQFADSGLRSFVRGSVGLQDRKAWEQQESVSIWDGVKLMFVVLVLGGAAAALFFNQQSVLGIIVTGVGVLTPLTKLLSEAQSFRSLLGFKSEGK